MLHLISHESGSVKTATSEETAKQASFNKINFSSELEYINEHTSASPPFSIRATL